MKSINPVFIIILLTISLICGCSKTSLLGQKTSEQTIDKSREPIILQAKMIDNIAIPADSEIISDKSEEKKIFGKTRTIKIKVPAAVYDVTGFFKTEMPKNSWTSSERNNRENDPTSITSSLEFTNEKEKIDVRIVIQSDDSSEVELKIGESDEYRKKKRQAERAEDNERRKNDIDKINNGFPMSPCADEYNTLKEPNSLTLGGECAENISSVAKFFTEMAPQNDWELKEQTGKGKDADSMVLTFAKGNQKALVTLIKNDENSTSLKVRISK